MDLQESVFVLVAVIKCLTSPQQVLLEGGSHPLEELRRGPAARERPAFALAASLVAGVSSGLASAFVSQPADTVVTRLAVTNATDVRAAIDDVLSDAPPGDRAAQAKLLYAGVAQRMASTAIIVTAQFILFDGLRALLAVSKDDLSVVLDVFKDRISLYEGWDEISESWIEAVDTLDDDLDLR